MIEASEVLVIVPAFNEAASVSSVLNELVELDFDVLLVSDGSEDRTAQIARETGVVVLELPINLGVGGALRAGFRYASRNGYKAVVQVDGDGQHPASEINNLIESANSTSADMVIGSRFLNDVSTMKITGVRRVAMYILSKSASSAAKTRITDSTSGFRLIKQPLLNEFAQHFANNYLGDTYESVISAGRANYKVVEIPATLRSRINGESTASSASAFRFTLKGLGVAVLRLHHRLGN